MSSHFCILIPSKVFQLEKRFPEKLQAWVVNNFSNPLPDYSMLLLSKFRDRQDVNLDLTERLYSRYYVIDWEFCFMEFQTLQSFILGLAKIYVYGEIGLLEYWSDERRRSPPVTVGNIEESISTLAASELPLNKLLFFRLTNYSS